MKKGFLRLLAVLAVLVLIWALYSWHLGDYLSLDALRAHRAELENYYTNHRLQTIGAFLGVYILATALSLPGAATLLTLLAGALFGFTLGVVLVSFASAIGATCAFLVARFILRDWVQSRFEARLRRINEGVRKEGATYLFALRIMPAFPFFIVNLVMALTPIRTWTFYWVSQLGMLAGTAVYVNAGTQLSRIHSLKGIVSPAVLLSFTLLGIFPFAAKAVLNGLKRRRVFRKFAPPRRYDYNLVVIGAGSAGLVAAYIAAAVKARVALVEKARMGGDCLNTGCVPSKALIRAASVLSDIRRAKDFGFREAQVDFDFAEVMERVQKVIRKVVPHDSVERYTALGVECFSGNARIRSPFEVEVDGKILTTRNIVIATGATPFVPAIPGVEEARPLTSDTIWNLRKLPARLVVVGAGPVGCELAQCFHRFGSKVTLIEMGPRILGREDEEVSDQVLERFRSEGMTVLTGYQAKAFLREGDRKLLICQAVAADGREVRVEFDEMLFALGRRAEVKGFGLEELGVELAENGTVAVDEFLRTLRYPNLFVCGDVAGPYQFTHVASHQAWFAAVNALFGSLKKFRADYRVIPRATFTDPEVARVGLNEREAREQGIPFEVTRFNLADLDRAIADEEDHGFIKVLTRPGSDRILGVTIVGFHASEVIAEYVTAMKHGLGLSQILGTIHIYPTYSEMNKYAAGEWKKTHAPRRALRFLKRYHAWLRG